MAELRNIKWQSFVKGLLDKDALPALYKSRSLQWWLTKGFRKQGFLLLDDLDKLTLEYKGVKFYPDLMNYPRMFEAWNRYRLDLIKPDDIVLDIGANIGSFSLPAAKVCKKVIAVEPIWWPQLKQNVELNGFSNVDVVNGSVETFEVDCQEVKKVSKIVGWPELMVHKPTVIRLDIGGSEWKTFPDRFGKARQLEIEFHFWERGERQSSDWNSWRTWLDKEGFGYKARWSKHRHWLYLSASREYTYRIELQLSNGDMRSKEADAKYSG